VCRIVGKPRNRELDIYVARRVFRKKERFEVLQVPRKFPFRATNLDMAGTALVAERIATAIDSGIMELPRQTPRASDVKRYSDLPPSSGARDGSSP